MHDGLPFVEGERGEGVRSESQARALDSQEIQGTLNFMDASLGQFFFSLLRTQDWTYGILIVITKG